MYTWCGNTLFHHTFRFQTRESGVQLPTQPGTWDGLATVEQSLPLDSSKLREELKLTSITGRCIFEKVREVTVKYISTLTIVLLNLLLRQARLMLSKYQTILFFKAVTWVSTVLFSIRKVFKVIWFIFPLLLIKDRMKNKWSVRSPAFFLFVFCSIYRDSRDLPFTLVGLWARFF